MLNHEQMIDPYREVCCFVTGDDYIAWRRGSGNSIELLHIYVVNRRQGVGRNLLREMIRQCALLSPPIESVYGFTRSSNEIAIAFYKAIGFDLSEIKSIYADGDAVIFSKHFSLLLEKFMTYNPGQLYKISPRIVGVPSWFIVGGPSDAEEAQCAVRLWPDVKVVGVEPLLEVYDWQLQNNWPTPSTLFHAALGKQEGTAALYKVEPGPNSQRRASTTHNHGGSVEDVSMVTLDQLDKQVGPFDNCFLWLDIEGAEFDALQGAIGLFEDKKVNWVNVEITSRDSEEIARGLRVREFLFSYGLTEFHIWDDKRGPTMVDILYSRP